MALSHVCVYTHFAAVSSYSDLYLLKSISSLALSLANSSIKRFESSNSRSNNVFISLTSRVDVSE